MVSTCRHIIHAQSFINKRATVRGGKRTFWSKNQSIKFIIYCNDSIDGHLNCKTQTIQWKIHAAPFWTCLSTVRIRHSFLHLTVIKSDCNSFFQFESLGLTMLEALILNPWSVRVMADRTALHCIRQHGNNLIWPNNTVYFNTSFYRGFFPLITAVFTDSTVNPARLCMARGLQCRGRVRNKEC